MQKNSVLLNNMEVIRWCYEGVDGVSLKNMGSEKELKKSQDLEKKWGNKILNTVKKTQWTTALCQDLVMEALIEIGRKNVTKKTSIKSSLRNIDYYPDLECDKYVYEVKGRSWCTTGTAGEKILGTPLKYGELPRLYKKPLQIILVGYQEYEAREKWAFGDLFDKNNQTIELRKSLALYRRCKIEYIGFTDILKELKLQDGCWLKKGSDLSRKILI